ncbi:MAG: hypothetical protein HY744_34545, partial [Deltaproteobacteria bacterium]|nr:hypothetical protein [Deltaproteobacteria bacterium]MBI4706245.1 hypothetical protein [Deltaproteobacteria bacterium]
LFMNRDIPGGLHVGLHGEVLAQLADSVHDWPSEDLFPAVGLPSLG